MVTDCVGTEIKVGSVVTVPYQWGHRVGVYSGYVLRMKEDENGQVTSIRVVHKPYYGSSLLTETTILRIENVTVIPWTQEEWMDKIVHVKR
jgi:hypothetical protein